MTKSSRADLYGRLNSWPHIVNDATDIFPPGSAELFLLAEVSKIPGLSEKAVNSVDETFIRDEYEMGMRTIHQILRNLPVRHIICDVVKKCNLDFTRIGRQVYRYRKILSEYIILDRAYTIGVEFGMDIFRKFETDYPGDGEDSPNRPRIDVPETAEDLMTRIRDYECVFERLEIGTATNIYFLYEVVESWADGVNRCVDACFMSRRITAHLKERKGGN